jgi:DNA-binding NtrC family response regulator
MATAAVLIVDDDPSTREVVGLILRSQQHTVVEAEDAHAALEQLATNAIGVALVDRHMPGHDGLWLMSQMRDRFPAVAIIVVSGDDAISPRFTLQPGVLGYLIKPVAPELMIKAVSDAMTWHEVAARRLRST